MAEQHKQIPYIRGVRNTLGKLAWPFRKLARFALFHGRGWGGAQAETWALIPFRGQHKQRPKVTAWARLKKARFADWHVLASTAQASALTARMQTRARQAWKKAAFQFRKRAGFALFHGRGWGAAQTQSYTLRFPSTKPKQKRKFASYALRKLARFTVWHTGATPPPPPAGTNVGYLKHRYVKSRLKKPWQYIKASRYAFFPIIAGDEGDFGGGIPIAPFNVQLVKARAGKKLKRASFVFRKLARFETWHTGAVPPAPSVINGRMPTRKRRKLQTSFQWKKQAHFFPLLHTGKTFTVGKCLTRERKMRPLPAYQFRKQARFYQWHTGFFPPPPPTTGENWISIHGGYRMRRPIAFSH